MINFSSYREQPGGPLLYAALRGDLHATWLEASVVYTVSVVSMVSMVSMVSVVSVVSMVSVVSVVRVVSMVCVLTTL